MPSYAGLVGSVGRSGVQFPLKLGGQGARLLTARLRPQNALTLGIPTKGFHERRWGSNREMDSR